ncbi:unnamed protein product [Orchesella dallaii]|uniref:Ionotropic receptor n=1 Tax=Orchesella dallaii TaxID=48710 RepID=A0ABP1RVI5_9HEXA
MKSLSMFLTIFALQIVPKTQSLNYDKTLSKLANLLSQYSTQLSSNCVFWMESDLDPSLLLNENIRDVRLLTISKTNKIIRTERTSFPNKFVQPNNIVFAVMDNRMRNPPFNFEYIARWPNTVLVYFLDHFEIPKIRRPVANLAAIKLFVFPIEFSQKDLQGIIHSNRYFKQKIQPVSKLLQDGILFTNPLDSHKRLFRNGNKRQIRSLVNHNFPHVFNKWRYACSIIVFNPRYRADTVSCSYDIMTSIYIGEVHNLTIELWDNLNARDRQTFHSNNLQTVGESAVYNNIHWQPVSEQSRVHFSDTWGFSIIYCLNPAASNSTFKYNVWIDPFPLDLWSVVGLSLLICCILVRVAYGKNCVGILFALFMGQGFTFRTQNYAVFCVMAIPSLLINFYWGNEITSLMVVPPGPKPYKDLREMVLAGVKILEGKRNIGEYKTDFERNGMQKLYGKTFHYAPVWAITPDYAIPLMVENKLKFALLADLGFASTNLMYIQRMIATHSGFGNTVCKLLPDALSLGPRYRIFMTQNRYWMYQTIERMRDAGLVKLWDSWSQWVSRYYQDWEMGRLANIEKVNELIERSKIFPVLSIWGVFNGIGIILFVIERWKHSDWRENSFLLYFRRTYTTRI